MIDQCKQQFKRELLEWLGLPHITNYDVAYPDGPKARIEFNRYLRSCRHTNFTELYYHLVSSREAKPLAGVADYKSTTQRDTHLPQAVRNSQFQLAYQK